MTTQIQRRRGTTAQHSTFTGAVGEVTVDTDKEVLVVHDGAQVGGYPQMRENGSNSALSLGSAATPSLKFSGDTNTGIYSPGADSVAISTGGSQRLNIDATGNMQWNGSTDKTQGVTSSGRGFTLQHPSAPTFSNWDTTDPSYYTNLTQLNEQSWLVNIANGPLIFGTNATERLRVTSAGLVGVGTSSPSESIHTTGKLRVGDGGNYTVAAVQLGASNANGISYPGTNVLNFITNSTAALTIDASQRVGVGTTSPSQTLDCAGNIRSYANAAEGSLILGSNNNAYIASNSAELRVWTRDTRPVAFLVNDTERARIDSSGRLLVGTSSARANFFNVASGTGATLQIEGTSYSTSSLALINNEASTSSNALVLAKSRGTSVGSNTILNSGDIVGTLSYQGNDGSEFVEAARIDAVVDGTPGTNDMPGRLVFSTTADGASSPTERMRIDNAGKILIAQTSTYAACDGWVNVTYTSASTAAPTLGLVNASATAAWVSFSDSATVYGSITRSGSSTVYATSSDYRLKENVTAVTGAITRLQQLKPSRFNFIAAPGHTVDGFLAHEVQTVVPEAITGTKDAVDDDGNPVYQGIDQSKLVPLLTAALQEAVAKIESLEARLTAAGI